MIGETMNYNLPLFKPKTIKANSTNRFKSIASVFTKAKNVSLKPFGNVRVSSVLIPVVIGLVCYAYTATDSIPSFAQRFKQKYAYELQLRESQQNALIIGANRIFMSDPSRSIEVARIANQEVNLRLRTVFVPTEVIKNGQIVRVEKYNDQELEQVARTYFHEKDSLIEVANRILNAKSQ